MDLYDLIVPKDNLLRKINDQVVFTFVFEEVKDNYCHDNGRNTNAIDHAESSCLIGMELQGAMAIFTVNLKRILKLLD